MLSINKQTMYYSVKGEQTPVYQTDSNGDIVYIDIDGESVPVETGDYTDGYSDPVEFSANISNNLNEAAFSEFGIDDSGSYAQITADKDYLPLSEGDLIWKSSATSERADYIVKATATEGLRVDLFLLKKNV